MGGRGRGRCRWRFRWGYGWFVERGYVGNDGCRFGMFEGVNGGSFGFFLCKFVISGDFFLGCIVKVGFIGVGYSEGC